MANNRTLFNLRGEGVNVHPPGVCYPGLTLALTLRADRVREAAGMTHIQFELPKNPQAAGALIALIGDNAGLAVEVRTRGETWGERLNRERQAVLVKRLHLKPHEHDLYATGDEGVPNVITDSNGEVVLGLCRKCDRAEAELDEVPVCDGVMPGTIGETIARGINEGKAVGL